MERLGVQFLAVGDDFRFGASARAISHYYRRRGRSMVLRFAQTFVSGVRISSTAVDQALAEDNWRLPACWDIPLLFRACRSWRRAGDTVASDGELTAAPSGLPRSKGVYAVEVTGLAISRYPA